MTDFKFDEIVGAQNGEKKEGLNMDGNIVKDTVHKEWGNALERVIVDTAIHVEKNTFAQKMTGVDNEDARFVACKEELEKGDEELNAIKKQALLQYLQENEHERAYFKAPFFEEVVAEELGGITINSNIKQMPFRGDYNEEVEELRDYFGRFMATVEPTEESELEDYIAYYIMDHYSGADIDAIAKKNGLKAITAFVKNHYPEKVSNLQKCVTILSGYKGEDVDFEKEVCIARFEFGENKDEYFLYLKTDLPRFVHGMMAYETVGLSATGLIPNDKKEDLRSRVFDLYYLSMKDKTGKEISLVDNAGYDMLPDVRLWMELYVGEQRRVYMENTARYMNQLIKRMEETNEFVLDDSAKYEDDYFKYYFVKGANNMLRVRKKASLTEKYWIAKVRADAMFKKDEVTGKYYFIDTANPNNVDGRMKYFSALVNVYSDLIAYQPANELAQTVTNLVFENTEELAEIDHACELFAGYQMQQYIDQGIFEEK